MRQVRCGCGRVDVFLGAWVLRPPAEVVFVLCARCARFPEKRMYLGGLVARRCFGPAAVLHWREYTTAGVVTREIPAGDAAGLARFRSAIPS
jgi:hypothetical protein